MQGVSEKSSITCSKSKFEISEQGAVKQGIIIIQNLFLENTFYLAVRQLERTNRVVIKFTDHTCGTQISGDKQKAVDCVRVSIYLRVNNIRINNGLHFFSLQ